MLAGLRLRWDLWRLENHCTAVLAAAPFAQVAIFGPVGQTKCNGFRRGLRPRYNTRVTRGTTDVPGNADIVC